MMMNPLTQLPALPPPAGITSNFVNPQSQASIIVAACTTCLILVTVISLLRFYTNLVVKKSFKADDSMYLFSSRGEVLKEVVVCAVAVVGHSLGPYQS